MAMRLFKGSEFEAELKRHGLTPTEFKTEHLRLWKNDQGAMFFLPMGDGIPDYVLDRVLEKLNKLYQFPATNIQKVYTVEDDCKDDDKDAAEILPLKKPDNS